jgi:hypothetical protein
MEILETDVPGEVTEDPRWSDPPPPRLEEQALDLLAFELWQRASRQDAAAEEDCPKEDMVVGTHASCL